ncbi:putative secreted hydrolase [Sphingomonas sp. PvP055]|uniref:lipocalin-like domain-containing protein n=1 Tax=Sphingomonas sp. PvP055 TaxID=3156391 RepID=UPI00339139FF
MARASTLVAGIAAVAIGVAAPAGTPYPQVRPGIVLRFPADHGAHPAYRTEWWYVTGWLRTEDGKDLGFQVTFFRTRPPVGTANPSRFAATQVLFAHAALSDPTRRRLLHGERAARQGFGLASATVGDADVAIRDWALRRGADGRWRTTVAAEGFKLALVFDPTQPPIPQGQGGYSRKGPRPDEASYYYSIPHLRVSGTVEHGGRRVRVRGTAWLDREWSSNYLAPQAQGWDWTGLNLDDGSALMAYRIRRKDGGTLWAGGSLRTRDGRTTLFAPGDVVFRPVATWRSPVTGARYPVAQDLTVRVNGVAVTRRLTPMFAGQELDARRSGLPVYWEGAVQAPDGRGYLELTGYAAPLAM